MQIYIQYILNLNTLEYKHIYMYNTHLLNKLFQWQKENLYSMTDKWKLKN